MTAQDHLFVSYAPGDWALAEWLTLRLTRAGYRIWCSRFPVLGGERYPRQTEEAITTRAFRVLVLLSRASLAHPATTSAMALATTLGRQRGEPVLVPLLTDDLPETGLDPRMAQTAVSFRDRWESGLAALLTALGTAGAPRDLADGERVAEEARQFLASRRSWHTVL